MDMQQKREERKKKSIEIQEEGKKQKTNINWYPGHMTRAFREIDKALKSVDMIIELRDARVVDASRNPEVGKLAPNKPRLIILSKRDLADSLVTERWVNDLTKENQIAIALDFNNDDLKIITEKCQLLMNNWLERQIRKGIKPRAIRAMILGIPNVGKSTLINRLAKRKITKVADKPGVTRALQWVKVNKDLELLDTPGVLWPRIDDQENAQLLAITGAINDQILDLDDLGEVAYLYLYENYRDKLNERYGDVPNDFYQAMDVIAKKRNFYIKDQEFDHKRSVDIFFKEIRSELFKGVSWQ